MKIITVPNAFSVLRILLTPVVWYYLSLGNSYFQLLVVSLLICLTDFLDGYTARKFNQITESGKILDPVADKITIGVIAVGLVIYRDFPVWALALLILRDVIILIGSMFLIKKKGLVPSSNMLGKVTVTVYAALIIVYLLDIDAIKLYILYLSMVFLFLSLIGYYKVMTANTEVVK